MKALLEIKGEHNKIIQPYLPNKYFYAPGQVVDEDLGDFDCLIYIDAEVANTCLIETIMPSETGEAYYEVVEILKGETPGIGVFKEAHNVN